MDFGLYQKDAVDFLKELPDKSIDLVVTDPPYESLEKYRKIGTTTRLSKSKSSNNIWFDIFYNSRFPDLFQELYRVSKADTHLYMFSNSETMFEIVPMAQAAGFKFWKPLVWDKQAIGMGYHYRAQYEFILFFEKGKRKLKDLGISDILSSKRIANGYPTEKPVDIIQTLIKQSSELGDIVLDPFCGSGSAGEAALKCDRRFLGSDTSEHAYALSMQRLKEHNGEYLEDAIARMF